MSKRRKILIVLGLIVVLPFAVLKVLVWVTGPPDDLGVRDGRLAPCPDTPNCVSSRATDERHAMAPLSFEGEPAAAMERLKRALRSMPRVTVIEEAGSYLRVEFRTAIMRFVDDGEFLIDAEAKRIHFRSAARLGYSDLGKNRERMETLRDAFQSAR
ncbi:MAG: DUF1499 domain-containing protein [Planctomycetota bacterium]|nr:DUF1499 domain-containing protein [Planctomycetota bacterium]